MRIVFIGFNPNGEKCLAALLEADIVPVVVMAPDGYDIEPMQTLAGGRDVPFLAVGSLNRMEHELRDLRPDLMVVCSYPRLLRAHILSIPPKGVLNVHTAMLPTGRGMHPLNWALIRDEPRMGVTVHYMDEGMDSGDVVAQRSIPVGIEDDVNTMKDRLTTIGAELLVKAVRQVANDCVVRIPQDHSQATLAPRRGPEDGRIDWSRSSREVFNLCRALYTPYPTAFSEGPRGRAQVQRVHVAAAPGTVLAKLGEADYVVATGDGTIFVRLDRTDLEVGDAVS